MNDFPASCFEVTAKSNCKRTSNFRRLFPSQAPGADGISSGISQLSPGLQGRHRRLAPLSLPLWIAGEIRERPRQTTGQRGGGGRGEEEGREEEKIAANGVINCTSSDTAPADQTAADCSSLTTRPIRMAESMSSSSPIDFIRLPHSFVFL